MKVAIKLHSFVDIITNSSTVIYTDYSASVQAVKELIAEIFKTFNVSETVDEVFTIRLEPDHDRLYDYISDNYEDIQEECVGMGYDLIPPDLGECENWQEKSQKVEAAITEAEEALKPNWLTYVQEQLVTSGRENELVLISNDPKYDKLVNVIIRAINSPDQTAEYDS